MPKNIIYLHTHDTGRFISPYGYAMDTPNLDRFARQGILFRRAFDCGPTCSPARASLLTGQYPHQCGMLGLAHRGFSLNDPQKHLAVFLKSHGYHTVLAGFQHEILENHERELGYDELYIPELHGSASGHSMTQEDHACTRFVCDFLNRADNRPFFLSLGLKNTHRPFMDKPDAKDNPDYMFPPPPIPNTPETRADWAAFSTGVRLVDQCFGQVFDTLRRNDLEKDTLVFVTTDHGPAFPGMKCCLNDHGCGVMLLMRIPGVVGGQVPDALVTQLDLYPTICEWAGLLAPDWLEGKSLLPLLRGETQVIHPEVYAEINFHAARDIQRTIRTERYRYVRRYDEDYDKTILSNIDDGPVKRLLRFNGNLATRSRIPHEQLFDLYYDPSENHSVAGQPEYRQIQDDLRCRLDRWMQATSDPLLDGPLQPPPGARVNRPDCIEPIDPFWIEATE